MKRAFSIIEIIFVIVIIGILAVIAMPKITATRDDAKKVIELNNITNCIEDIGTSYTSRQKENDNTQACNNVVCAYIDIGKEDDGNVTVTLLTSINGKPKYCDYVKIAAQKKGLEGVLSFGGIRVKD